MALERECLQLVVEKLFLAEELREERNFQCLLKQVINDND